MTRPELLEVLKGTGFPIAYRAFPEQAAPKPPFICYIDGKSNNFPADGRVYHSAKEIDVELYTDKKDLEAEKKVEAALDAAGIFYESSETYIASEKMYQILYEIEV